MKGLKGSLREEYAGATALFEAMERMRKIWALFKPEAPLKRSDMMLLGTLAEMGARGEEPATVSRVARKMHQSAPGVSQKVSVLEAEGYVRRTASPKDRRVGCLELTEKGQQVSERALRGFLSRMEEALARLGPEKAKQLEVLMQELGTAIEQSKGEDETC